MVEGPAPGVGEVAATYLGNLLYALERCALSLEGEGKPEDAGFYRGIGRLLAEAHGRARGAVRGREGA
ncbi:MAG: hypothetical protein RLZ32_1689 [Gemmatimonadota bacterium]|jgi:hypothetical protein